MSDGDRTTVIQGCLDRLHAGDDSAREALLESASERLSRLARKMLKGYPGVHRWEQTDDVLQNALIRLDRALRATTPRDSAAFFRLAATQIRRELIDLARHYYGPKGLGANYGSQAGSPTSGDPAGPSDDTHDPEGLATWSEFHARVEALPEPDRELFDMLWYQGLTHAEVARLLGVSERTISTRWVTARLRLADALGGQLPG